MNSDRRRTVLWFDADPAPAVLAYAAAFGLSLAGAGNRTALVCSMPHADKLGAGLVAAVEDAEANGMDCQDAPVVLSVDLGLEARQAFDALHASLALGHVEAVVLVYPRELCALLRCNLDALAGLAFRYVQEKRPALRGVTRH